MRPWPAFLILAVDSPATVDCVADGWPPPTTFWQKAGVRLTNTSRLSVLANGSLHFHSITFNDSGRYVCVARNSLGVQLSVPINVTIACLYHATLLYIQLYSPHNVVAQANKTSKNTTNEIEQNDNSSTLHI